MFALEAEAASIYCKSLRMNKFQGESFDGDVFMPPGTVYAIVDAGGMYYKLVISIVKTYLLKVRYVTRTLKIHLSFAGSLDALSGRGHARIFGSGWAK